MSDAAAFDEVIYNDDDHPSHFRHLPKNNGPYDDLIVSVATAPYSHLLAPSAAEIEAENARQQQRDALVDHFLARIAK